MSRTSKQTEMVELDVDEIKHRTAKAILVIVDTIEYWIPLSQVFHIDEKAKPPTITTAAWLAKEKGLI